MRHTDAVLGDAFYYLFHARLLGQSLVSRRARLYSDAHGIWRLCASESSGGRATAVVCGTCVQHPTLDCFSTRRTLRSRRGVRRGCERSDSIFPGTRVKAARRSLVRLKAYSKPPETRYTVSS